VTATSANAACRCRPGPTPVAVFVDGILTDVELRHSFDNPRCALPVEHIDPRAWQPPHKPRPVRWYKPDKYVPPLFHHTKRRGPKLSQRLPKTRR